MAKLGIVSDDQFEQEILNSQIKSISSPKPLEGTVIEKTDRGRGKGSTEVPEGLRKLIADEAIFDRKSALNLASDFGISPSSVSAYTKGATSTASYNEPNNKLQSYITNRKNRATKKSLSKLHLALDSITPDKLNDIKARDLAGIAKDMSVIAKNMEPVGAGNEVNNRPNFVVYAPTIRDERSYETIVVNDSY